MTRGESTGSEGRLTVNRWLWSASVSGATAAASEVCLACPGLRTTASYHCLPSWSAWRCRCHLAQRKFLAISHKVDRNVKKSNGCAARFANCCCPVLMSWNLMEFLHGAPALVVLQQIRASVARRTLISFVKRSQSWEEDIN